MEEQQYRFRTLYGLGSLISFLGWAVLVIGGVIGLVMLVFARHGDYRLIGVAVMIAAAIYGVMIVAGGQMMQCLVAIEHNTRTAANRLSVTNSTTTASLNRPAS